ncbi:MAG: hypothetical protein Q7S33_01050 [Nanoarchaeota archaeon]|nr:hypothetical protein [Nanoarchaeota archaeon]
MSIQNIPNSKIKSLFIQYQKGISNLEKRAVMDGAKEMIDLANAKPIRIVNLGENLDYIQGGQNTSKNNFQLNANTMINKLSFESQKDIAKYNKSHYNLIVLNSDIYSGNNDFILGLAMGGIGTILSTYRFQKFYEKGKYECIKTETMHELGHVFGLIADSRKDNIEMNLGKHCTNKCIMRQGITLPDDWIEISKDRLKYGAFCPECSRDLKKYFEK